MFLSVSMSTHRYTMKKRYVLTVPPVAAPEGSGGAL